MSAIKKIDVQVGVRSQSSSINSTITPGPIPVGPFSPRRLESASSPIYFQKEKHMSITRLAYGLAALPLIMGVAFAEPVKQQDSKASAKQPMQLTEQQMDKVTAGWDILETDCGNTHCTWLSIYQNRTAPIAQTEWLTSGSETISPALIHKLPATSCTTAHRSASPRLFISSSKLALRSSRTLARINAFDSRERGLRETQQMNAGTAPLIS